MPNSDLGRLRGIKTFSSLVKYLRDDLDWPIESENFDDLTFDFEPEELGIDPKTSAKIESIKQLRPLSSNQPWGIFFVKFEPKKLPVVALRRILGQLVIKKRASANRADQQTWRLSDLLFLSNYGENEQRQITFAHFSGSEDLKNLPTLQVLGWDDSDTVLHIDHAHATLRDKLRWPDDENNVDTWRKDWSSAFILRHREVIETSKELAIRLAGLAQQIRKRANSILSIETESGPLKRLMAGFKEALIHDLTEDSFADMYAQTIAYGLLSARITNPKGDNPDELSNQMPITNPFLKELMESFLSVGGRTGKSEKGVGIDFDELGINEVVALLNNSNMEAVVRDFGDKNPLEDPVIHFYELFLHEYDSKVRMQRGVFYTPRPVVSFIVRSVDEILRTEFGLEDGLADTATWGEVLKRNKDLKIPKGANPDDPFVQILDPATGTGTFLVEVIDLIHKTMVEKWEDHGNSEKKIDQLWNEYVSKHLLPRLNGYELLMAPYAIAHMKIGLKLHETGYRFCSDERTRVYLTNALEPEHDFSDRLTFAIPALAHEAKAVNRVKESHSFTVVIGNPPYSKNSANRSDSAEALVSDYKEYVRTEKNVQPLSDDYIKFLAFSISETNGHPAIIGMITNRSYLCGLIHRGMRNDFINKFSTLRVIDLHGDSNVGESAPDGMANQNVFEIIQGVSISLLSRTTCGDSGEVLFSEAWGTREEKYDYLGSSISGIKCEQLTPEDPYWFLIPIDIKREKGWVGLDEIFLIKGMGVKSRRDHFLLDMEYDQLKSRFSKIEKIPDVEEIRANLNVSDNAQWTLAQMQELVRKEGVKKHIKTIQYRPFDKRYIWYHPKAIERGDSRWPVMKHILSGGISLLSSRQSTNGDFSSVFVARGLSEMKTAESSRGSYVFPLLQDNFDDLLGHSNDLKHTPNYKTNILGIYLTGCTPSSLLGYIYAILHSPGYRNIYRNLLRIEFPKIPLHPPITLGRRLSEMGEELINLHLLESPKCDKNITSVINSENFIIKRVSYSNKTIWVNNEKTNGFEGVPEQVWKFQIGGYQVCDKWLKYRGPMRGQPGKLLTEEDLENFQKVIVALNETIRIMDEIDEVVEEHGGWPGAFVTESGKE